MPVATMPQSNNSKKNAEELRFRAQQARLEAHRLNEELVQSRLEVLQTQWNKLPDGSSPQKEELSREMKQLRQRRVVSPENNNDSFLLTSDTSSSSSLSESSSSSLSASSSESSTSPPPSSSLDASDTKTTRTKKEEEDAAVKTEKLLDMLQQLEKENGNEEEREETAMELLQLIHDLTALDNDDDDDNSDKDLTRLAQTWAKRVQVQTKFPPRVTGELREEEEMVQVWMVDPDQPAVVSVAHHAPQEPKSQEALLLSPPITHEECQAVFATVLCAKNSPLQPEAQPEAIPGGFLIRGQVQWNVLAQWRRQKQQPVAATPQDEEDEEDAAAVQDILEALEEALHRDCSPEIADRVRIHAVHDPTFPPPLDVETPMDDNSNKNHHVEYTLEELLQQEAQPVLFLTRRDLSVSPSATSETVQQRVTRQQWLSALTGLTMASFVSSCLFPHAVLFPGTTCCLANPFLLLPLDPITWQTSVLPLSLGLLLASCLAPYIAQQWVARANEMELDSTTWLPSPPWTTVTPLRGPAKNRQSLFDFAVAGPLVGFLLSLVLLMTTTTTTDTFWVTLPLSWIQSSRLVHGLLTASLGNLALMSSTDNMIALPPLTVAGFVGIMTNALRLLPFGDTDGGRVFLCLLGRRSGEPLPRWLLWGALVLARVLYVSDGSLDIWLGYMTLLLGGWHSGWEIPCWNEIDELDPGRTLLGRILLCGAVACLLPATP